MLEEAGYQQLLAELEQERENIERMIVYGIIDQDPRFAQIVKLFHDLRRGKI
jgi:hypothetical protein